VNGAGREAAKLLLCYARDRARYMRKAEAARRPGGYPEMVAFYVREARRSNRFLIQALTRCFR